MRLKKIKLAGFKSFVDPTTIPITGNLIGIVGPNGCGKSNVIDAVRWVMGESSAKHLRGDSMSDVIFSGSTARKPVGKASVELIFDTSDGSAPGQYASYAEISVKREATRDGQSDYFLNKTKCRRKDITDIFLGTGLGPRAYSIIEQGMVTRIIEAKPEDLRAFFEEAAGVSRYKERRRETEIRIRHARENLARVEDIRKELETQLNRLQRQSKAASKYKELKQQERLARAQLLALRWQELQSRIQTQEGVLANHETVLEGTLAQQRAIEAEIEKLRSQQTEATDHFNKVQAQFYSIGAEITSIEQAIQHAREVHQQQLREQEQLNRSWQEASAHLDADRLKRTELKEKLGAIIPQLIQATSARTDAQGALTQAETAMQAWQDAWEKFTQAAAEPVKTRDIQRSRMQQLGQNIAQLKSRQARLVQETEVIQKELAQADESAVREQAMAGDRLCEAEERRLEQIEAQIKQTRLDAERIKSELEDVRGQQQNAEARLTSLRELQTAALGKHDAALNDWLSQRGLDQAPHLAGLLSVDVGWEKAVERVLGSDLAAVCVANLDGLAHELAHLPHSDLVVFDLDADPGNPVISANKTNASGSHSLLQEKVTSTVDLSSLLSGVYIAEDIATALAMRSDLAAHESVVTRSGIWLGKNWLGLTDNESARAGMLGREREIEALGKELKSYREQNQTKQVHWTDAQKRQQELDSARAECRKLVNNHQRERAALHAKLGHKEAQLVQLSSRQKQIEREHGEIIEQVTAGEVQLATATRLLQEAETQSHQHEQQRESLTESRDKNRAFLEQARTQASLASELQHQLQIEQQGMQTALDSAQQSIVRLESQLQHLQTRRAELDSVLAGNETPEADLKQHLEEFLQKRLEIEGTLTQARTTTVDLEAALREQEQARTRQEQQVQETRQTLEQERMARQELVVRRQTLEEQLRDSGFEQAELLGDLVRDSAETVTSEYCQAELDQLIAKIERLGPINLVAIQEFEEQSQRKTFLDSQSADLTQALNTLEDAIRKIDRETRTLFKDTFDKVNVGFQTFFPRLFGGGSASLELNSDDLLNTGVTVMARPPGKRNSTIHLLSGGEKALTAVALLFAIFELNPAPFCLLDEVDAPLDDANVERYSQTLQAMSEHTQLIYITHNKISMEIAQVLLGVTMSEPGVSRLVAVDVDEAMEMVTPVQNTSA